MKEGKTIITAFLVIHESGAPVYSYFSEKGVEDREVLVSGFITAIQAFAKEALLSPDGGDIQSMKLSQTLLTFRLINIRGLDNQPIQYYFVLLTELTKKQQLPTDAILEYLCLNFLSYNVGEYRKKLRNRLPQLTEFKEFDDFLIKVSGSDWKKVSKQIKPVPASLVQGVLNEIRDYIPLDQILRLHPKIVQLGRTYVWLSDDLTPEEEEDLLGKVKQMITRLFGEAHYDKLITRYEYLKEC
jgi:hypothetical protein